MTMDRKTITMTEIGAMLRRSLKEAFPDVTFSVRMSRGRSNSFDVSWTDGPSIDQVDAVAEVYAGSYFDGMQDLQGARYFELDGVPVRLDNDYVSTRRDFSDLAISRAIARVLSKYAEAFQSAGLAERPTVEEYRRGALMSRRVPMPLRDEYSDLQQMVYRALRKHTDRAAAKPSATRDRLQFVGEDGHRDNGKKRPSTPQAATSAGDELAAHTPAAGRVLYLFEAPQQVQ